MLLKSNLFIGFARLLIFGGDKFYFVKILNEFQV